MFENLENFLNFCLKLFKRFIEVSNWKIFLEVMVYPPPLTLGMINFFPTFSNILEKNILLKFSLLKKIKSMKN